MVLVIFSSRDYDSQVFENEVQICTLGSNAWRRKPAVAPNLLCQGNGNGCLGVFLHGCIHWFVSDESVQNDQSVIVAFNLSFEEFGFISTPGLHKIPHGFCRRFGVLDECLCLVECCRKFLVNVWVMQKYNVNESWVKRFTIMLNHPFYASDLGFKAVDVVKVGQNGEVVVLCDDKYMAAYNIKCKEWRIIEVEGFQGRGKDFVGSLEALPVVSFAVSMSSMCAARIIERLPAELMTNILSRLPFRSTAQCKSVCKPWLEILSNPTFLWVHLANFASIDTDILAISAELQQGASTVYYLEEAAITETPCKPFKHLDYTFLQQFMVFLDPRILGSCHGFICVTQGTNTPNPGGRMFTDVFFPFLPWAVAIFNPITKGHSRLPRFEIPDCDTDDFRQEDGKFFYKCFPGLGFEDLKKELKMVLVMFSVRNYKSQFFDNEVQICTLRSKAWRKKIGIAPDVLVQATDASRGAFVNGCLHWIVAHKSLIVSFDLGVEEFGFVSAPPLQNAKDGYHTRFGVLDGCLSVIQCRRDYIIDIWLMLKYDVKESWVKRFCLPLESFWPNNLSFDFAEVLKIRKNGELVLLCDDKYMVSYDPTSQDCRVLEVQGYEGKGIYYDGNLLAIPFAGSNICLKAVSGTRGGT